MIIIFDLDDTLYPEISYVKSGFAAVSKHLCLNFGLHEVETYTCLLKLLKSEGRGKIFDDFLKIKKIYSKKNLNQCISVYRKHSPKITLYSDAITCIKRFKQYKKYIITDGNINVQRNKIEALEIKNKFIKIIPTYQYGLTHSKPSVLCFNKIMQYENCLPSEMIYIGDNPNKDFINLKKTGIRTARILRGSFKAVKLDESFEAEFCFKNLNGITKTFIGNLYENR